MAEVRASVNIVRGDTIANPITIVDEDGSPLLLADMQLFTSFEIAVNPNREPSDASEELLRRTLTPISDGRASFTVTDALWNDTAGGGANPIQPGLYFFDVQAIDGSGARQTFKRGNDRTIRIHQDTNKQ